MKKHLLLLFAALLPLVASAEKVEIDGIWYNLVSKVKQAEVTFKGDYLNSYENEYSGSITLPATVTYEGVTYSVTSIGEGAFWSCSSLTAITIPEGVTSIGDCAFEGCRSLTAITIPEGVTSIGDYAFDGCSSLHSVVIGSGVLSIGISAFRDAPLEKVIWLTNTPPSGYKNANGRINYVANNKYSSLSNTKVYPYISSSFEIDGVTYVPNPADMTCDVIYCRYESNITEVKIDNTVTYKGKQLQVCEVMPYAFYKNKDVESIVIYNDGNIGVNAFYDCKNLKTFEVGRDIESIGDNAFYGCSSIENFTCYAKQPPVCGSMAIDDIDKWGCTLNVPEKAVERYKAADQWESFFFTEGFEVKPNIATFVIDGECYATVEVEYGEEITLPATPEKEGHAFAGWTDMPTIMPSNDIVVHGEFAKNKYKVEFIIDGKVYHSDEILYGDAIELIEEPTKEGYTFSGWSKAPETMPAEDVTISGTFTINKYLVTFKIDDEVITSDSLEYGANIVAPEAPEKEGYTFNGWGNVAWKVPAHDLTYEGTYKVNSYTLRYVVDDMSYKTVSVRYGDTITLIDEPTKEGYTFSGWSKAPETMPAEDVTITGTFKRLPSIYLTINQADNGYVKQHLIAGSVCTYTIEAAEGWKIHSVTFNGEDVTSQLTEEGTFTTPTLIDDATLNIAYEKIDNAITSATAKRIKVQGYQGIISITGTTEGTDISLYTTDGTLATRETAEGDTTHLTVPTGQVYIVKVADTVVKIGM